MTQPAPEAADPEIDREWIQRQLTRLGAIYNVQRPWKLLDASAHLYQRLALGENGALQTVVDDLSQHLEIPPPEVTFEWGLRMSPEVAGDISIMCRSGTKSFIRIPFFYVGRPYAIGAILAHELSHHLNAVSGIWETDRDENERLTDLSAIASGMGKLTLNGMSAEACDLPNAIVQLSYLQPECLLYAYELMNRRFDVDLQQANFGVLPDVVSRLTASRPQL